MRKALTVLLAVAILLSVFCISGLAAVEGEKCEYEHTYDIREPDGKEYITAWHTDFQVSSCQYYSFPHDHTGMTTRFLIHYVCRYCGDNKSVYYNEFSCEDTNFCSLRDPAR